MLNAWAQEDGNIKEVSAEEASAHLSKKLGRKVRFSWHLSPEQSERAAGNSTLIEVTYTATCCDGAL